MNVKIYLKMIPKEDNRISSILSLSIHLPFQKRGLGWKTHIEMAPKSDRKSVIPLHAFVTVLRSV